MALLSAHGRPATGPTGFSLAELLVALSLGLLLWGVVLQALVAEGRQVERLVRQVRERGQQRRVLSLLRGDLQRVTSGSLAAPDVAAQRAAEAVDSGAARDRLAQWAALTEALAA